VDIENDIGNAQSHHFLKGPGPGHSLAMTSQDRSRLSTERSTNIGPVLIDSRDGKNGTKSDLLQREADYKRLNDDLEAKTKSLFAETESMLRQQEEYLAQAEVLERTGPDYYLDTNVSGHDRLEDDDDVYRRHSVGKSYSFEFVDQSSNSMASLRLTDEAFDSTVFDSNSASRRRPPSTSNLDNLQARTSEVPRPRPNTTDSRPHPKPQQSRSNTAPGSARPGSSGSIPSRPKSSSDSKPSSARSKPQPKQTLLARRPTRPSSRPLTRPSAADDVAVFDDASLLDDVDLEDTFQRIGHSVAQASEMDGEVEDDILPPTAQDMGHEAKVRFLKAKIRVLQEELERSNTDRQKAETELEKQTLKMKSANDEMGRLQKAANSHQAAMTKQKQVVDDLKARLTAAESQTSTLKRQNDGLQRDVKSQQNNAGASEVRLNRATEEIEKLKSDLQKAKSSSRENQQDEKKRMETLLGENRRLEKQKSDLIQGFRKQARLIDILKRQKMHLEAAKMLQFTEEEFVKALEWGSN